MARRKTTNQLTLEAPSEKINPVVTGAAASGLRAPLDSIA